MNAEGKGFRTAHPRERRNRLSRAARPTVSGYLPSFLSVDRRGIEPRFPGCRPGVVPLDQQPVSMQFASDRGGSRTHKITRLSTSPLFLFAYPAAVTCLLASACSRLKLQVRVSHPAAELMRLRWALAHLRHGSPSDFRVTKGRVELPCPCGHDVLSVACLPVPPLGRQLLHFQVTRAGIEPALAA